MSNPAFEVAFTPVDDDELAMMRNPIWLSSTTESVNPRPWCGHCPVQRSELCRKGCNDQLPGLWCGKCNPQIFEHCSPSCYSQRLLCPYYHRLFADRVIAAVPEPPCSWCGYGACDWCETCDRNAGPASAICLRCESSLKACRLCYAWKYVYENRAVRRPQYAARRFIGERLREPIDAPRNAARMISIEDCINCNVAGHLQKCAGCRVVHYCGSNCQRSHWKQHKPVCKLLRGAIPVNFVYSWQLSRISSWQTWSQAQGGETWQRFQACFGIYTIANSTLA